MNSDSNNGGKKRCKCKKSKCLKLYCECFAAGWYCDETCECQECFNSRDYEDTVEKTRQEIESRNPSAFSSKIRCDVESPTTQIVENGDQVKPVAGKHIRGCNCKKSMCQKKYCECYQANVGCSTDCRCLGCENKFGKRAEYSVHIESIDEIVENEKQFIGSEFPLHEFNNPHNSTLDTPLQHISHENDPSTTGSYTSTILQQPETTLHENSNMMLGTSTGNFDINSYLNAYMNQFTPPDYTHFKDRHLNSMMNISPMINIPPLMNIPNSSTPTESYYSAISWPDSLMDPVNVFGMPEVINSNEKPNTGARLDFNRYK